MTTTIRLATDTATGHRYVVLAVNYDHDRVTLWGDVVRVARNTSMHHEPTFTVDLATVTIATVARTGVLCAELFEQTMAKRAAKGHVLTRSGRRNVTVTDHGTPSAVRARMAERAAFVEANPALVRIARELGVDLTCATPSERAALAALAAE